MILHVLLCLTQIMNQSKHSLVMSLPINIAIIQRFL